MGLRFHFLHFLPVFSLLLFCLLLSHWDIGDFFIIVKVLLLFLFKLYQSEEA